MKDRLEAAIKMQKGLSFEDHHRSDLVSVDGVHFLVNRCYSFYKDSFILEAI